ncbi:MAG: VacJ family lipoprotein [Desulfobulbaceae bacterium]|nr:VacJ family lipoprotein [Desulfobulbaceae bacterium]
MNKKTKYFGSIQYMRFSIGSTVLILILVIAGLSVARAENDLDELLDFNYEEEAESQDVVVADPLEAVNRGIFIFNDKAYIWVIDPVASTYKDVVAEDIRGCISSFFYNLEEPIRIFNAALQGRMSDSARILSRFVLNSILGVYGFADVATTEFNIPPVKATLGETFARWGVGDGCYLVIPFMGSSTVRDFTGDVIDSFGTSPYWYWTDYKFANDWPAMMSLYSTRQINRVSFRLGEYEDIKELTLDPYIAFRNVYYQKRAESDSN